MTQDGHNLIAASPGFLMNPLARVIRGSADRGVPSQYFVRLSSSLML